LWIRAEEVWLEKLEVRLERRPIWKNSSQSCTRLPPRRAPPHLITLPPSGQKLLLMDLNVEDILSPHISVLKTYARGMGGWVSLVMGIKEGMFCMEH